MRTIPRDLYTKEIKNFITYIISSEDTEDFQSLDEMHQDEWVALCIKALGFDVDIILSPIGNNALAKFLFTYDKDKEIEIIKELKQSAKEKFSSYFDDMFNEEKENRYHYSMYEAGKRCYFNRENGELGWY